MKKIRIILLIFFIQIITKAQTFEGKSFTTKNGLCDNEVRDIFQDSKGFLWILTGRGLNVYDGKSMKKYPDKITQFSESPEGFVYGLSLNTIHKYTSLKKTEILATKGISDKIYIKDKDAFAGVKKIIDNKGIIYYYYNVPKEKRDTITVYIKNSFKKISIKEKIDKGYNFTTHYDNNNKCWVVFNHTEHPQELYYFEDGNLVSTDIKLPSKEYPLSVFQNRKKEVYIFMTNEILKISGKTITSIALPSSTTNMFFQFYTNKAEDSKGNIWVPTYNGLLKISGNKCELIEDKNPRAVLCDKIFESSYNEKGEEIKEEKFMCDGRTFAGGLAIDSKDRIYTGNKIYENGRFTEVFGTKDLILIEKIIADKEDNIWYATANGLFKYQYLPISNLTLTDGLKGDLIHIDNKGYVYTKCNYTKLLKAYTVNTTSHILIYKPTQDKHGYTLFDSVLFDLGTSGSDNFFLKLLSTKNKTLIFNQTELLAFDGQSFGKINLNLLPFKSDKFFYPSNSINGKNEIYPPSVFKDSEGFVWFCCNGNYVKTDGTNFACFGKEIGIQDSLAHHFTHEDANFKDIANNIIFCFDGFYYLKDNKFIRYNLKEQGLSEDRSKNIFASDGKKGIWFFCDSVAGPDKKHVFLKFEDGQFTKFELKNPEGISILSNRQMTAIGNNCIIDMSEEGFIRLEADEKTKTATVKRINIGKEYFSWHNRYRIEDNKLFLFPDISSLIVFPINLNTFEVSEPVNLYEYIYLQNPIDANGKIYFTSGGGFDERREWIVEIDPKTNFINPAKPQLNIISISFETDGKTKELFNNFDAIEIPYNFNPLKIDFKGICLTDGEKVKYKYFLEGLDTKWNETNEDRVTYTSLSPGTYTFKILACNNHGIWNESPTQFTFTVLPPWNRTWWAYCIYVFAGFAAIRGYLKKRTKKLEKEKQKLEHTVEERTLEIAKQKEMIEEKNKEMIDSITYAKRIQKSLMPTDKYISRVLKSKDDKTK